MGTLNGKTRTIGLRGIIAVAAVLLASMLGVGCSKTTSPVDDRLAVEISFSPVARAQTVELNETMKFLVTVPNANKINVNWKRKNVIVSEAESYTFRPAELGVDTLLVQVEADGIARNYFWVVDVIPGTTTIPSAVPLVAAAAGVGPGDIAVTWRLVSGSAFPIAEYLIAMSTSGEITAENWDEATALGSVPNRLGAVNYQASFTAAEHGVAAGTEVWLAVRALDQAGQISPVGNNGFTTITATWWLTGVVVDDTGAFPPYVSVRSVDPVLETNVDGTTGRFRLGPFRSIDEVEIYTRGSTENGSGWYDFRSAPLDSISGRDFEVLLIKRHFIEVDCRTDFTGGFLDYLRAMTFTLFDSQDPENTKLWKWESYPVRVHVPDLALGNGVDYAGAARFAMAFWDSVMGESYFEEVATAEQANIVFLIDNSRPSLYGEVSLLEPSGPDDTLSDVIPEKLEIYLSLTIPDTRGAKEIVLHEFGHTLGLWNHSGCALDKHLMTDGAAGFLNHEHPIHIDEQNAVRCIRRLQQGVDTASFSLGLISPR